MCHIFGVLWQCMMYTYTSWYVNILSVQDMFLYFMTFLWTWPLTSRSNLYFHRLLSPSSFGFFLWGRIWCLCICFGDTHGKVVCLRNLYIAWQKKNLITFLCPWPVTSRSKIRFLWPVIMYVVFFVGYDYFVWLNMQKFVICNVFFVIIDMYMMYTGFYTWPSYDLYHWP